MKAVWFDKIDPETKEDFKRDLGNFLNGPLVIRLVEIIEKEEANLTRLEMSSSSYEDSAWIYKQAHINGERQALKIIKDLIKV